MSRTGETTRVAAIDCGTNSVRLLIADVAADESGGGALTDIERRMEIVRLGQGVDQTGWLAPEAPAPWLCCVITRASSPTRARRRRGWWRPAPPGTPGMQTRRDTAELTLALAGRGVRSSVLRLPRRHRSA